MLLSLEVNKAIKELDKITNLDVRDVLQKYYGLHVRNYNLAKLFEYTNSELDM